MSAKRDISADAAASVARLRARTPEEQAEDFAALDRETAKKTAGRLAPASPRRAKAVASAPSNDVPLPPAEEPEEELGEPEPALLPTIADPLRGLEHLSKVALLGRERILAIARKPPVYVWADIVVAAQIAVLAGGVGEGKTTLLFLILVARMNAGSAVDVLGRRVAPAPPGKFVVLIEGEHGEGSTARKLERSAQLLGIDLAALDRIIIVARKAVRIGSPEWRDVIKLIAAGLVSDIALDTIARVAPSDANSEAEQVAIFEIVSQAIEAAPSEADKPTAWICAHRRKGDGGGLESVSGSAQRTGQGDTVLLVKGERDPVSGRIVQSKVTFDKLREDPDEYPQPVTFSIVAGDYGRRLVVDAVKPDDKEQPLEERITAQLRTGPKTMTGLSTALGRNKPDLDVGIGNLFAVHAIQTTSVVVRGRRCKAYELRGTPDSTPYPRSPDATPYGHRTSPESGV